MKKARPGQPWSLPMRAGLVLGAVLLAAACAGACVGPVLNTFGKGRLLKAFARACPGYVLEVGKLDYRFRANTLTARGVTLRQEGNWLKVDRVTVAGVRWGRVLFGRAGALAQARLELDTLAAQFPGAHYGATCARVEASMPGSELRVEEAEVQPLLGDEALFRTEAHRMTRYHVRVPQVRITGLAWEDALKGRACRAGSVRVTGPTLDALADRYKAVGPVGKGPLMVNEALNAVPIPLTVDSLQITGGHIQYGERRVAGEPPGRLTFGAVALTAEGITNRGGPAAALKLEAEGRLMETGLLRVRIALPLAPGPFALEYEGGLGPMDLTRLDAFLDRAERTRIKSGHVARVGFKVAVRGGHARGQVSTVYQDLAIAVLDPVTDTEHGLKNRAATLAAKLLKVRPANPARDDRKGRVDYRRQRGDTFFQVLWFSLRSGVLDAIKKF